MQTVTARAGTDTMVDCMEGLTCGGWGGGGWGLGCYLHAEGTTVYDVGGGAGAAGLVHLTHRPVRMGGAVLGEEADEDDGPQAAGDAGKYVAAGGGW